MVNAFDDAWEFQEDLAGLGQLPGATGESSGGRSEMAWPLARAAIGVGADGIFIETHPNPEKALCDGPISLPLKNLVPMLKNLKAIFYTHMINCVK